MEKLATVRISEIGLEALASQMTLALLEAKRRAEALEQAAEWFQQYADSHTAKGDTDKAKRNQDRADFCRAALVPLAAPPAPADRGDEG